MEERNRKNENIGMIEKERGSKALIKVDKKEPWAVIYIKCMDENAKEPHI